MTSIKLTLTGAQAQAQVEGILTAGMVGIPVTISYDEQWEGLSKTLICKSAVGQRCAIEVEENATVAPEVMRHDPLGRNELWLGVEGRSTDGTLVFPSTMTRCGEILPGAATKEIELREGHGAIWAQIMNRIGNMKLLETSEKEDLVSAINEVYQHGISGKTAAPLIVNITEDEGSSEYIADKNGKEILEAVNTGRTVYANIEGGITMQLVAYAALEDDDGTYYIAVFSYEDITEDGITSMQAMVTTVVFAKEILGMTEVTEVTLENNSFNELPNPYSMRINGVSYDGSSTADYTSTINAMIDAKIKALDATGVSY